MKIHETLGLTAGTCAVAIWFCIDQLAGDSFWTFLTGAILTTVMGFVSMEVVDRSL